MELVAPGLTNIIAWLAMLVGVVFAGWWAVGLLRIRSREEEQEGPEIEAPAGLREKLNGVPPVLVIFIVFVAVAMVGYILAVWLAGVSY